MAQFDDAPGTVRLRDQAFGIQLNQAGIAVRRIKNRFDINPVLVDYRITKHAGVRPDLRERRHYLEQLSSRLEKTAGERLRLLGSRLAVLTGRLNARNPLTLLSQGYAIVSREGGGIVAADNTRPEDLVHIRVLGARFTAKVTAAELLPGENAAGED